ncbi:MAG TPA: hypothetical protein VEU76_09495 [Candidatus Udaeobacter sp.]|nr:hypothetical protein [Candidatus Udaeobacter sp.]
MKALAWIVIALMLTACGGRETPDDQGLHQDIVNGSNGAEVTFDGSVANDPVESGGHERFTVDVPTGDVLEIDHNTSLAQSVPLQKGASVVIHGQLYIDPGPHYGVHCTHAHTSSGCPNPGWIEYNSNYYE